MQTHCTISTLSAISDLPDIDIDYNQDGLVYIKQEGDWVVVDSILLEGLIEALTELRESGAYLNER